MKASITTCITPSILDWLLSAGSVFLFRADANGNILYQIANNPGWDQEKTLQMITKLTSESSR